MVHCCTVKLQEDLFVGTPSVNMSASSDSVERVVVLINRLQGAACSCHKTTPGFARYVKLLLYFVCNISFSEYLVLFFIFCKSRLESSMIS